MALENNVVAEAFEKRASISDLKGLSELVMSGEQFTDVHLAMIKDKNHTFIGEKQYAFMDNDSVVELLERVRAGELSKKRLLSDMVEMFECFDGETYFDHKSFSGRIKKHLSQ
ncbi:hypothetical protein K8R43_04585 [archaeon]|nr:hypothetical protein [archaeon]